MRLAKVVSYLFHPVFMPLLGVLLIFNSGIYVAEVPLEFKRFVYAMVILCTTVLPLTLLPAFYIFRSVGKITPNEKQQRIIPLFFTTICFFMGYFMLARYSPVKLINLFLFSCAVVALGTLLISFFWKISLHMAGIGGLIAMIAVISLTYTVDMTVYLSGALLVAGIIASSRLALQEHSIYQVMAGFLVGFLFVGAIMFDFFRASILDIFEKLI